eukprot:gene12607-14796_t
MGHHSRISIIFTALCILAGILITASGIYLFVGGFWHSVTSFVVGCYFLVFGVMVVVLEIFFPPRMASLFGFYQYWFGKGLFFILIGLLILGSHGFFLFSGIVVIAVGVLLCVIHFIAIVGSPRAITHKETSAQQTTA